MIRGMALLSLVFIAATGPAFAQAPNPGDSSEAAQEQSLERYVGDRIARIGLLFIRNTTDPSPRDYQILRLVLEEAAALVPNDKTLTRRLLEASHALGDNDAVLNYTSDLLRLEPDNTVAQLRVIASRIQRMQEAEKRIEAYRRLLSPAGDRLSDSVRSRLALDGALLARELGDEELFVEWVTRATQLDMTNKQAAILAANYSLERLDDPLARVELLANVVLADPIDPGGHINLARELMDHGAYNAAARFYTRAAQVMMARQQNPRERIGPELMAVQWATEGAEAMLEQYSTEESVQRYQIDRARAGYIQSGASEEEVRKAIPDWSPHPPFERVRLAAAVAANAETDIDSAMSRLDQSSTALINAARERFADASQAEKDAVEESIRNLEVERLWQRLWSGRGLDTAAQEIEERRDELTDNALARYEGWLALQRGDLERARELLERVQQPDMRARLGLAAIAAQTGDRERALGRYAEVALAEPRSLLGLFARTRLTNLLDRPLRLTKTARSLETYVRQLPQTLDAMTQNPHNFIELDAEVVESAAPALDRSEVRLTLKNIGAFPLAVGSNSPINSSVLLAPRITAQGENVLGGSKPEVVSLDQRLRLRPGESFETVVWADQGATGIVLDERCANQLSLRWRALQGFSLTQAEDREFVPGPMSVTAESGRQTRYPVQPPGPTLDDFERALNEASGVRLLELITYARNILTQQMRDKILEAGRATGNTENTLLPIAQSFDRSPDSTIGSVEDALGRFPSEAETNFLETLTRIREERQRLGRIIGDRYASMSEFEQAFTLISMPASWSYAAMAPVDRAALQNPARLPMLVVMLLRLQSPDDRTFDSAVIQDDPRLSQIADLLRARLRDILEQRAQQRGEESGAGNGRVRPPATK